MKAKLARVLGIVLAGGMFVGAIDSSAAEALMKQNVEGLEVSAESMDWVGDLEGNMASEEGGNETDASEAAEVSTGGKEGTEAEGSKVDAAAVDNADKIEEENVQEEEPFADSAIKNESEPAEGEEKDSDAASNSETPEEGSVDGDEIRREYEFYYEPITGIMVKGPWILPDGRKVFYDTVTGQMVKGDYEIGGKQYHFDEIDGHMSEEYEDARFWLTIDNNKYLYINWERQGWKPGVPDYRGEEVYDSETDAWYWLDCLNQGKMAVDMDIYQETQADDAGNIGKWVHYGENGQRVRGWTEDGRYYFDPVYGTRAQGTVVIDGEEYEFDLDTGERIRKLGFENYGIACNVTAGIPYAYRAATCDDSSITTEGTAMFAYNTFRSDDSHPEREGYIWKQVIITLAFDDINAHVYGCRVNTLFGLDYYNFNNEAINEPSSETMIEKEDAILFQGEEYPITIRHEVLRSEWGDDCAYHMEICIECHMPAEYDGMAIALYHARNAETGKHELDLLDEDSLIFRME